MKKNFLITAALLTLALYGAQAQNDRDAFRYSLLQPTGTARHTALGGAMGAFGADFSTASTNPAALGTYNRSEFSFSPSLYFGNTTIDYNGESDKDYKSNFNFGNIGVVLTIPNDEGSWKAVQISTGINRMGNFNSHSNLCGSNMRSSSFVDYIADQSNDLDIMVDGNGDFTGGSSLGYIAWMGNILGTDAAGNFCSMISGSDLWQEKASTTRGSMNEYVFSISGNYNDRLFVGATLGIPYFSYHENYTYMETNINRKTEAFNSMTYGSFLESEGSGINFKAGMLYQPANFLRFGVAVHSPTFYSIEEQYDSRMIVSHDSIGEYKKLASDGEFEYSLTTPYRILADVEFIFGNYGFINVDYEMADYSIMRLRSETYSFRDENRDISRMYRAGHTLRAGAELNLSPMVLRTGYAYMSNPFNSEVGRDASHNIFSAGFGFRTASFHIDFAYQYVTNTDNDRLYKNAPYTYTIQNANHSAVVTTGWKF